MPRQIVVDGKVLGSAPDDATDEELAQIAEQLSAPTGPGPAEPAFQKAPEGGAVSRFFAPIGEAAKGLASLPRVAGNLVKEHLGLSEGAPYSDAAAHALIDPSVEQARGAVESAKGGDYKTAALQALATLDVGGAGNDIGESVAQGDIAGAAGKGAVLTAPFVGKSERVAGPAASFLRNRAAKRMLDAMAPARKFATTAEEIAPEVVAGTPALQGKPLGIGFGTRKTLAARAKANAEVAGQEIEQMQNIAKPVPPGEVTRRVVDPLRSEAASLETQLPEQLMTKTQFMGPPITQKVPGEVISRYPEKAAALRDEAAIAEKLANGFGKDGPPAGELFKQRSAGSQKNAGAYNKMAGDLTPAKADAGKAFNAKLSELLHSNGILPADIPAEALDRSYRVWKNASVNFERGRISDLTNRGYDGLKDLLAGRIVGGLIGGATGLASGYGVIAGAGGAIAGAALGESAFWQTLRASTYHELAGLLNNGEVQAAGAVLDRAAKSYAAEKAIHDREKNRKASQELSNQAQGVVAP